MRIPEELEDVLESTPDTLSGAVRFVGTRVPVQALLDSMAHELPVSDFLEGFPNVPTESAYAVKDWLDIQARNLFGLEIVAK